MLITRTGYSRICKWYRECIRTRVCDRLISPPFVCNGCENERICPLPKKFYIARAAQADRDSKLHESRKGVHATNRQIADMNAPSRTGAGSSTASAS